MVIYQIFDEGWNTIHHWNFFWILKESAPSHACSSGYENISNFRWANLKFHNHCHTTRQAGFMQTRIAGIPSTVVALDLASRKNISWKLNQHKKHVNEITNLLAYYSLAHICILPYENVLLTHILPAQRKLLSNTPRIQKRFLSKKMKFFERTEHTVHAPSITALVY